MKMALSILAKEKKHLYLFDADSYASFKPQNEQI